MKVYSMLLALCFALFLMGCNGGVCSDSNCACESGDNCDFECPQGNCSQACGGSSDCAASCEGGGCQQSCTATAACEMTCAGGGCTQSCTSSDCNFSCAGGSCLTGDSSEFNASF